MNFREQWPASEHMSDHLEHFERGRGVANEQLILPGDGRFDIALASMTMGTQAGAVFAEGTSSNGKSQFGNIVFGDQNRVDIVSTDTAETLEGYESPIDHEMVQGKIDFSDPEDFRLFLDEISHMRDSGVLHKYWTGDYLPIPGVGIVDISNGVFYATANHADGIRSKALDGAARSRVGGISVLTGDITVARAMEIDAFEAPELAEEYRDGLLPPAKERTRIRGAMYGKSSFGDDANSAITGIKVDLNKTGLLNPIDLSNKRKTNSWKHAALAARLVDAARGKGMRTGEVSSKEIAEVAALSLGSIATLTAEGSRDIAQLLDRQTGLDDVEKAIFARRTVAAVAMNKLTNLDNGTMLLGASRDELMKQFMDTQSFADTPEAVGDQVDEFIIGRVLGSKAGEVDTDASKKKKRLFRRG